MKKQLLLAIAFIGATFGANAQFDGNFETLFGGKPAATVEIEGEGVTQGGVQFVGDTRTIGGELEKLHTMKYEGNDKTFTDGTNNLKFTTRLSFNGSSALVDEIPVSRIVKFKPTSEGVLKLAAQHSSTDERNIIIAKMNNGVFTQLWKIDPKTQIGAGSGNSSTPWNYTVYDYTYTEGDEIWIYADANIYFWGFLFSGSVDTSGVNGGTDPEPDPTGPVTGNRTWSFSDNAVEETTSDFTYTEGGNELSVSANGKKCVVSIDGEYAEGSDAATTIGYLSLGGSGAAVSIPSCNVGDIIEFIIAPSGDIADGAAKSRGLQVEGADYFLPIPWTKAVSMKFEHTVGTSGNVILSSYNSGIWILDLSVKAPGTSQIETNDVAKTIIATEYYNIAGLKMNEAQSGLNIVKNYYEDGSVKVNKIYK